MRPTAPKAAQNPGRAPGDPSGLNGPTDGPARDGPGPLNYGLDRYALAREDCCLPIVAGVFARLLVGPGEGCVGEMGRGGRVAEQAAGFVFRVFVSVGQAELCDAAVARLHRLCETHLPGRYVVDVVDVDAQPDVADAEGVVVVPTVVRDAPFPQRRVIGDLSDDVRTAAALGLPDPDERALRRGR